MIAPPAALQIRILLGDLVQAHSVYRRLRKHLDRQPVGYPASLTGVELKLLKEIFSVEEAQAALCLDYRHRPFETIRENAGQIGYDDAKLLALLTSMEQKGSIYVKYKDGTAHYALHPLVLGMFEFRLRRMTAGFVHNLYNYVLQRFLIEYLTTEVPQMRVIPIQKSLTPKQAIATYDQIRALVDATEDRICVTDCLCKVNQQLLGKPCQTTERREVCIGFRDWSDTYLRQGWGRAISKTEAMEILDQNEKDGLVLQINNMQAPQFVCSCCACCCGIFKMVRSVPRPADFTASNFVAEVDPEACNGCQRCLKRCHMKAIRFNEKSGQAVAVDPKRCIGCGLCVATCKTGALRLKAKEAPFVPPKDEEALYETLMRHKKGTAAQLYTISKAMLGMRTRPRAE